MARVRPRTSSAEPVRSVGTGWRAALCGLTLAALGCFGGCQKTPKQLPATLVGQEAPSFQLETLDHDRFYLQAHRGKPVVLVFWDTSCEICKREMVALEALRKTIGPERVVMASVCTDPESVDVARQLVQGLGLGFPTLLDRGAEVSKKFQVNAFPTTIVITAAGKVDFSREGYTEPLMSQLQSTIEGYPRTAGHAD